MYSYISKEKRCLLVLEILDVTLDANDCGGLLPVVKVIVNIYKVLQWLIPIGLLVFGLIDLAKAVIAGKEDEMKKAQGSLIKRVIYAVAVFFVMTFVTFAMGLVEAEGWKECWHAANGSTDVGDANG